MPQNQHMPLPGAGGPAKLIVIEENDLAEISLDQRDKWSFGRIAGENRPDIGVHSPIVSRVHGDFLNLDGRWHYSNHAENTNPTFYNGRELRVGPNGKRPTVALKNGDILRVDYENLQTPDSRGVLLLFSDKAAPGVWTRVPLSGSEPVLIGRDPGQCGIVFPLPYISARHAKIVYLNGSYYLSDCGSRDGTWLNGEKLKSSAILREKDQISICNCHLFFTGNSLVYKRSPQAGRTAPRPAAIPRTEAPPLLKANIITKKVPDNSGHGKKELIRNIDIEIKSGSLVAIIGPSGAGKSTVMNCINGMDTLGMEGQVTFEGEDLIKEFDRLKTLIGSVSQKNVIHPSFTPEEEFREAAKLRLPGDTTRAEIKRRVDETIELLRLGAVRKSRNSKLSGGEEKRVHIGVELVADRKLLCLDEPDAGLDPGFKHELFEILRDLAHSRDKCIMLIIHDVSEMNMFDQVIMLAKLDRIGRLAFSGSPAEAEQYFGCDIKSAFRVVIEDPQKYVKG